MYRYEDASTNGFKIREKDGDCIQAYTPMVFGVETDVYSVCLWDTFATGFLNMSNTFLEGTLFTKNHTMVTVLPSLDGALYSIIGDGSVTCDDEGTCSDPDEYEEAKDGFEALQKLPKQFDLLFVDINMPNINGLELIEYCRQNEQYQHIPIIIISTEDSLKDQEKGIKLGATDYLMKPINLNRLIDVIQQYINKA